MGGLPVGEHRGLCGCQKYGPSPRERRVEKKAYTEQLERLETERRGYIQLQQEQWAMIQRQANQLEELTNQLHAIKSVHLN